MERRPNRVHIQQDFAFHLQVSKWNLCDKNIEKKRKCCSAWNVHCRLAINM
jgi:hypothetical protein